MSRLHLSPAHVAAFAQHREALELCRRFGNIARFRAKPLRQKLKPLGLVRCGDRYPYLGDGQFEGFVLTPPMGSGEATGMGPEFAGIIVFGGVSLGDGLEHRANLEDADVPELQVGVLLRIGETLWPLREALLAELLAGLQAEGYEVHEFEGSDGEDDFLRELTRQITGAEDDADSDDEADFDDVEVEDGDIDADDDSAEPTEQWVDIDDGEESAMTEGNRGGSLLLLRRLPLDRLPARCGPIVTRFFASALAPLLALDDQDWNTLMLARDTRSELGEEE